ncbi:unnamed protein product [Gadus morhua 'NCC']
MVAQRMSDAELKKELSTVWSSLSHKTMDLLVTPHKPNELHRLGRPRHGAPPPPPPPGQTPWGSDPVRGSDPARGVSTLTNGGALPGQEVNAQESSSWLPERTKDAPRGGGKRKLSKGQSDDTPDAAPQGRWS